MEKYLLGKAVSIEGGKKEKKKDKRTELKILQILIYKKKKLGKLP